MAIIIAAESPDLNSRGQAFLEWFHNLWARWAGVFDWAGGFQDFAAVVVGIALIILILYGVSTILHGGWIAIKGIGGLIHDALTWLFIDLPDIWMKNQRRLANDWKKRSTARNRVLDTPVAYAPRPKVAPRQGANRTASPASAQAFAQKPTPDTTVVLPPPRADRAAPARPPRWPIGGDEETVVIKLRLPADIVVNEDTEDRVLGQAPTAARDKEFWQLANACVALFRDHAAFSNIPPNATEPSVGALAVNHQGVARGTYAFGDTVANLPGWTTALPGSPARMEAYITHKNWEVVASCVTFEDGKAKLGSWRMSSTQQGVSNVSLSPQGKEYGVTVEEAYRFLARFLQDLAHPRF